VHVNGLDEPLQLAVTAPPESTLNVRPPLGAAPLPVNATLAEKFAVAVPYGRLTAPAVTVGVCSFTVNGTVPDPLI
jgi:hypothetical protein